MKLKTINYEVLLKNRFIVKFPKEFKINEYSIKTINKPIVKNNKWQPIEICFFDIIPHSVSKSLLYIHDFVKNKEEEILFNFQIQTLDRTGEIIEKWNIAVEKILSIEFGYLDYQKDEFQVPKMIIQPHSCVLL